MCNNREPRTLESFPFANYCVPGHTLFELLCKGIAYFFSAHFTKKNHMIFSIVTLVLSKELFSFRIYQYEGPWHFVYNLLFSCFLVFQKYFLFVWQWEKNILWFLLPFQLLTRHVTPYIKIPKQLCHSITHHINNSRRRTGDDKHETTTIGEGLLIP